MKKIIILIIVIISGSLYFLGNGIDVADITGSVVQDNVQNDIHYYIQDEGNIGVYFCPYQDCEGALVNFINTAEKSIHCALFDIGLQSVQEVLDKKEKEIDVKIVTDNDYVHKFTRSFVKKDSWGLMHNKFCIIDGTKVSTGSMNPTDNGAHKNNNNLLLITSEVITQNYEDEFQEMWDGTFKKGEPVQNPIVRVGNTTIETYFCPDDHCAYRVKEELKKAKESIYFMIFSFTHNGIGNILLLKHLDNITMQGVMEARQVSEYSEFQRLKYQGVDVVKDGNPNNMHHKVFVIDNKTVITGSFNPSNNGDKGNDENIMIIHDTEIASLFMKEFERVREESNK